jgi:ribosomal peptide maturation radical SAM protein 1
MAFRSKTQQRALDEVLHLASHYGDTLLCVDNIFDFRYLDWFFPKLVELKLGLGFHFETKVNLKKDHIRLLREAGVTHLQPGIESLSSAILRLMRKGCTLLQNVRCLRWARQYDVTVAWNLLYGFPGEDPLEYGHIAKLIPLLHHLDPPIFVSNIRMDRHSPYFNTPAGFGLENVRPYPAYALVYDLPDSELRDIAYYFEFEYADGREHGEYVAAVVEAAREWQEKFADGVTLEAKPLPNGCVAITDTRELAAGSYYELDALACRVLQECDREHSLNAVLGRFADVPHEDVTATLQDLLERHLVLREGDDLLSLPVIRDDHAIDLSLRDEFRLSTRMLMGLSDARRRTVAGIQAEG